MRWYREDGACPRWWDCKCLIEVRETNNSEIRVTRKYLRRVYVSWVWDDKFTYEAHLTLQLWHIPSAILSHHFRFRLTRVFICIKILCHEKKTNFYGFIYKLIYLFICEEALAQGFGCVFKLLQIPQNRIPILTV